MASRLNLGVYTALNIDNKAFPCYRQTGFLRELSELAEEQDIQVVIFDAYGVNFFKNQCRGLKWAKGEWHSITVSLPRVIYDRYQNFRLNTKSNSVRQKLCQTVGIRVFNSISTDKWLVAKLMREADLGRNIPMTGLVKNPDTLARYLAAHNNLWLKPCKGSQGKGIYCLTQLRKGAWRVVHIDQTSQTDCCDYYSEHLLIKTLYKAVEKTGRRYIIQEGVVAKRIDGNTFDIRVLVQRDHNNRWCITGQGLRISEAGKKVTNLIQGGRAQQFSILRQYLPTNKSYLTLKRQVEELALGGAEAIAKQKGYVGELGIDIMINEKDKPVFIEANTRPGRKIFKLIGELETRKLAHQRVLGYARYLLTHGQ